MEDHLLEPQGRDDSPQSGDGLEERLDSGAVLPECKAITEGKTDKLAVGPAGPAHVAKKAAARKLTPKTPTKAA